jgi:1,2-diacylglycerol 3-alpha-glucosyltransferase
MNLNTNSHTLPTASDLSTEKRSICLMNDSFPPVIDGVANAVTNYASVIQRSYGDATVVTPYYPDADDGIYPFPVLRYPSIDTTKLVGYRAGLPLSPELMAQVEGRHIDLIHSHCPVTSTILARMLRQRLHVPLVFTYHTKFDIDIANAIHSRLLQEASIKLLVENISACDEVWTVSRGAGENLRSLGYQGDYIVMPNGVDIPSDRLPEETVRAVSEGLDLPEGVPLLLFVGRMMWYKGLRIILDALKQLKGEGQDFRMVFIGKGTDGEAIRAYAEELCLGDKVFFLPPCYDREIIRAWYCRADLFLFPSTFDTNGLVVREAAACGLASVLIAGSCAAEDVTDGRNGFFIEENAASMAATLRRLMPQRELLPVIESLSPQEFICEGKIFYSLCDINIIGDLSCCRFLAGFDPLMLGYKKRSNPFLPEEALRGVFTLAGIVRPSILLDGKIVGVWKRRGKAVELTWLIPLQSLQRKRIEEEALRIFGDSVSKLVWRD